MNHNLSLKQKGMNGVRIFPPPPSIKMVDDETQRSPLDYGFSSDSGSLTYSKKIESNNVEIGYEVLDRNYVK